MAARGIYDTVKQAIQDVVAPQIQELKGEITGLRGEMRQMEKRMEEGFAASHAELNSLRSEMGARIDALDEKFTTRFDALDEKFTTRLDYTNKRLEETSEIRERLAALEGRIFNRN